MRVGEKEVEEGGQYGLSFRLLGSVLGTQGPVFQLCFASDQLCDLG